MTVDALRHRQKKEAAFFSCAGQRYDSTHVFSLIESGTSMTQADTPRITDLRVIPVAGRDSMLLNLSGAHGPFFTRNLLILTDSAGRTGIGEVPGGEKIRQTLDDARALVVGQNVGNYLAVLQRM